MSNIVIICPSNIVQRIVMDCSNCLEAAKLHAKTLFEQQVFDAHPVEKEELKKSRADVVETIPLDLRAEYIIEHELYALHFDEIPDDINEEWISENLDKERDCLKFAVIQCAK